ncbi:MAG: oligosaccharide flippase family protein, partial [Halioglobus sp.]|nr:oligosaccharide flippase family protein [Halioglobus sp.]
ERSMGLLCAATLLSFITGTVLLLKVLPTPLAVSKPEYKVKEWIQGVVPLTLNSVVATVNETGATILLGILTVPEAVGLYRIARSLASFAQYGRQALRYVIAPEFSRLWATQDIGELKQVMRWSSRVCLAIALAAMFGFALIGEWLLGMLYGPAFIPAYSLVLILIFGFVCEAACGFQGMLMTMTPFASKVTRVLTICTLAYLAFSILLISVFGVLGAAVGSALYLVSVHSTLLLYGPIYTGVRGSAFG